MEKTKPSGSKQFSLLDANKEQITLETSESERAEILREKNIVAPVYKKVIDEQVLSSTEMKTKFRDMDRNTRELVKMTLEKIATDFQALDVTYQIKDINVEVILSKKGIRESISKEATPEKLAKILPILKDTVENAVGVEVHNNRYYFDNYTTYFQNLIGGYVDDNTLIPVRFGLKHGSNGEATLYVIVDQEGIPVEAIEQKKKVEVVTQAQPIKTEASNARSTYTYSISQIIPFVNSEDLLRYIPDELLELLSEEQKTIKYQGIAKTIAYTNKKNDQKYMSFIAQGKLQAALDMIRTSAKANGYEYYLGENNREGVWINPATSDIKSGDVITYDDNDNVIPISMRFDVQKNDIRYSIEDSDTESPDVSESETDTEAEAEAEETFDEAEITDRDLLLAMAEQLVGAPAGVQRTPLRKVV